MNARTLRRSASISPSIRRRSAAICSGDMPAASSRAARSSSSSPAPSMPSCSSVRRLKNPTCRKFSIRVDAGLLGRLADQVLELGEVLGEQRARELGEVAAELALHALEHLRDLLQQLLEVHAHLAEARGRLAERLAQAVVEARPEQVEELVVGRDLLAALDHRGAQRVLEDLAVVDRELVERRERVDRLGRRDADPALAQDVRELEDLLLHAGLRSRLVQRALLGRGGRAARRAAAGLAARASPAFFWSSLSSSACAFRTSPSYLRITLKVWLTSSASSSVAFSASSARAQSSVSLIDGVFLRSSWRSRCIMPTRSSTSPADAPGTFVSRMRFSSSSLGKSM